MTNEELCGILDDLGLFHTVSADGEKVLVKLAVGDDSPFDVLVIMDIFNNHAGGTGLQVYGGCQDLRFATGRLTEALSFCNGYNAENAFASVYCDTDNREFHADYSLFLTGASAEHIRDFLTVVLARIELFFRDVSVKFSSAVSEK